MPPRLSLSLVHPSYLYALDPSVPSNCPLRANIYFYVPLCVSNTDYSCLVREAEAMGFFFVVDQICLEK